MLVERIPRECFTPSFELSSCRLPKFRLFNLVVGVLIRAQIWFRLTSDAWQLQVKSVAKHMTSVADASEEIHLVRFPNPLYEVTQLENLT